MEEGRVQGRNVVGTISLTRPGLLIKTDVVSSAAQVVFDDLADGFSMDFITHYRWEQLLRCPAALRVTNADGSNLFQIFARAQCTQTSTLAEMIQLDPEAARLTDVGLDMLHCAMNGDEARFTTVLNTWPQLVRVKDYRENTALHMACYQSRPAFIIKALLDRWPEALHLVNDSYQLPFHRLFKPYGGDLTVDALQVLLNAVGPNDLLPLLTQHDLNGRSPVHVACACKQVKTDGFLLLLHRCPKAFDTVDDLGRTPFFHACWEGAVEHVLHLLVQNRGYGYVADYDGLLPMHLSKSKAVVDALLLACPDTVHLASKGGQLPLHSACAMNLGVGIIETLLAAYPEAIHVADKNGMLPLHHLARNTSGTPKTEAIQVVLRASPKAARQGDSEGRLPLHYACRDRRRKKWQYALIKALVEVWSEALEIADGHGMLPLHYACQHDLPLGTVYALVRSGPHQVRAPVPVVGAFGTGAILYSEFGPSNPAWPDTPMRAQLSRSSSSSSSSSTDGASTTSSIRFQDE